MDNRLNIFFLTLLCGVCAPAEGTETTPVKPDYKVSLGQAHEGTLEIDTCLLDSYGRLPEERRTFYLTAREILAGSPAASLSDSGILEAARKAGLPLISGPMLGDVSESGITVWFRPVTAEELTVQVMATEETQTKTFTVPVSQPGAAVQVKLSGLAPNTRHTYRIVNRAGAVLGNGSFCTAPAPGGKEPVTKSGCTIRT
jgi:alkaline phosphatase D